MLGAVAGSIAWYLTKDWQWLAGAFVLLANWPFTMSAILPTNKRLMAMTTQDAGPNSRQLLLKWGRLHNVRSGLGTVAVLSFAAGLVDSGNANFGTTAASLRILLEA